MLEERVSVFQETCTQQGVILYRSHISEKVTEGSGKHHWIQTCARFKDWKNRIVYSQTEVNTRQVLLKVGVCF